MILTRQQFIKLLKEMNYQQGIGLTNFFKYTHDIDYQMTPNKEKFILTFDNPKEELVFRLKYSTCLY